MTPVPDLLPVLSRGKHRSAKRGACFMELASYLAGERWSDSPRCTHPLLAEVARNVNDRSSDAARSALAPWIADVVGLHPLDERVEPRVALHCVLVALPHSDFERQKALAVAALVGRRVLEQTGDLDYGRDLAVRRALEQVPRAHAWARQFVVRAGWQAVARRHFRRHSAREIVRLACRAAAASPEADDVLRRLLLGAIEECRALQQAAVPAGAPAEPSAVDWSDLRALTRV